VIRSIHALNCSWFCCALPALVNTRLRRGRAAPADNFLNITLLFVNAARMLLERRLAFSANATAHAPHCALQRRCALRAARHSGELSTRRYAACASRTLLRARTVLSHYAPHCTGGGALNLIDARRAFAHLLPRYTPEHRYALLRAVCVLRLNAHILRGTARTFAKKRRVNCAPLVCVAPWNRNTKRAHKRTVILRIHRGALYTARARAVAENAKRLNA